MRMTNIAGWHWLAAAWLVAVPLVAHAQVFKCTTAAGDVRFQDHACARGQRQQIIDVPSHAPPGYVPPPTATVAPPAAPAPVLPMPAPPPLPLMYACVGAVNGKYYLAHSPTPPYLAPLGVMGYPPESLSQVYGAPGGVGMSAPEFSKPRMGGPRIAAGMTEVQDLCLPAPHAQVCSYVEKQYEQNHHRLRLAMRNEQPPFEKREKQLQDELRNCR